MSVQRFPEVVTIVLDASADPTVVRKRGVRNTKLLPIDQPTPVARGKIMKSSGKNKKIEGFDGYPGRLKERVEELGITQEEVAARMGVSPPTVHNLLHGNHTYPIEILTKLAKALDWSLLQLTFEVEKPKMPNTPALRKMSELIGKCNAQRDERRATYRKIG